MSLVPLAVNTLTMLEMTQTDKWANENKVAN